MRCTLALRLLFRTPIKTAVTFLLLAAVSFALFARVTEYAMTAREFERVVDNFNGVGMVEVSPADYSDKAWWSLQGTSIYLTGRQYNPNHPDGTWEDTRYEMIPKETRAALAALAPSVTTSTRYMTAGVGRYTRLDDRPNTYSYASRVVIEATIARIKTNTVEHGEFIYSSNTYTLDNIKFLSGQPTENNDPYASLDYNTNPRGKQELHAHQLMDENGITGRAMYTMLPRTREDAELLVEGGRYIFVGRYDTRWNATIHIGDSVSEFWQPSIVRVDGLPDGYLDTEEFAGLRQVIEITAQDLHTCDIVYTDNMAVIPRFNDTKMAVIEGRMITPADAGKNVCVVSRAFAMKNKLGVGRTIELGLCDKLFEPHAVMGAVASTRGRFSTPVKDVELEIVGIYNDLVTEAVIGREAHWAYSSSTIFVPLTLLPESADIENAPIKPGAFNIVIDNPRGITAFLAEAEPRIEAMGLKLFFSDGGWAEIETAFVQTQRVTRIAILLLLFAVAAAATLVVYLFIGQKKKDYAVMRATGCPKRHADLALLVPFLAVAFAGVILGSGAAWIQNGRAVAAALGADLLSHNASGIDAAIPFPSALACIGGLTVFFSAAAWVMLLRMGRMQPLVLLQNAAASAGPLARRARHKATPVPDTPPMVHAFSLSRIPPIPARRGNPAPLHAARYIVRNMRRSWLKSAMTVFVSAALFAAACQLGVVRQNTHELYETLTVTAVFMNDVASKEILRIKKANLAKNMYYEYAGMSCEINGLSVVADVTNDPDRFHGAELSIDYAGGYGPGVLDTEEQVCILSGSVMNSLGAALGDTVLLTREVMLPSGYIETIEGLYTVAGRAEYEGRGSDALVPPAATEIYDLAEFTLADNYRAEELRRYGGFQAGSDTVFFMNTDELERVGYNLDLFRLLFPIMAVVFALIGGLLPGLIILQSTREASLLRILGAAKRRTRTVLAGQQLALYTLGLAAGYLGLTLYNGSARMAGIRDVTYLCAGLSAACYIAAAVIGAVSITRRRVLEMLQTKE